MKFFEDVYNLIAKKLANIFVLIGFGAAGAALLLSFIGGLTATDGKEFLYYFITLLFEGSLLAGVVLGYFKKDKRLLFGSFIGFFTLLFAETCVGSFAGVSALEYANGTYIAYWVFDLLYGITVGGYLVFLVLVYLFNKRKLEMIFHLIFLGIFPFGLLAWILAIVAVANSGINWTNAIVPLLEAASFLFFPAVLALADEAPKAKKAPKAKEEVKDEPKDEETNEVVDPEVEEEK